MMNPDPDDEVVEALRRFAERIHWFTVGRAVEEGVETDTLRALLAEWDEGLARHAGSAKGANLRAGLKQMASQIVAMRAKVRLMFLNDLHKLVESRFYWCQWEKAMRAPGLVNERLAEASPVQREQLQAALRGFIGTEFDASAMFRTAMDNADRREMEFQQRFDKLKRTWPDEWTPEMATRLLSSDAKASAAWMVELLKEMIQIGVTHPPLRWWKDGELPAQFAPGEL